MRRGRGAASSRGPAASHPRRSTSETPWSSARSPREGDGGRDPRLGAQRGAGEHLPRRLPAPRGAGLLRGQQRLHLKRLPPPRNSTPRSRCPAPRPIGEKGAGPAVHVGHERQVLGRRPPDKALKVGIVDVTGVAFSGSSNPVVEVITDAGTLGADDRYGHGPLRLAALPVPLGRGAGLHGSPPPPLWTARFSRRIGGNTAGTPTTAEPPASRSTSAEPMRPVHALALAPSQQPASPSRAVTDRSPSAARQRRAEVFGSIEPKCAPAHPEGRGYHGQRGPNLDVMRPSREKILRSVQQGVGVMPTQKEVLKPARWSVASRLRAAGRTPGSGLGAG